MKIARASVSQSTCNIVGAESLSISSPFHRLQGQETRQEAELSMQRGLSPWSRYMAKGSGSDACDSCPLVCSLWRRGIIVTETDGRESLPPLSLWIPIAIVKLTKLKLTYKIM